jgi:hypothetical protein
MGTVIEFTKRFRLSRLGPAVRRRSRLLSKTAATCRDFLTLRAHRPSRFAIRFSDLYLHLRDATHHKHFDRHYVYHTAWASRVLAETRPARHVDIASSLQFVSTVSAFVDITTIDLRPASVQLPGLSSLEGTLLQLPFASHSQDSVSCMHVLEHVGLGRYGDPVDYEGDLKAAVELARIVAPGGRLLVVVPITGDARIEFNAHRVYRASQILHMFDDLDLVEFALIPDDGAEDGLIRDASLDLADRQRYGCGCFHFRRGDRE